jgi:hypothetical protein
MEKKRLAIRLGFSLMHALPLDVVKRKNGESSALLISCVSRINRTVKISSCFLESEPNVGHKICTRHVLPFAFF